MALSAAGFHSIGVNDLGDPVAAVGPSEWWEMSPTDLPTLLRRLRSLSSVKAVLSASEKEAETAVGIAHACGLAFPSPWPIDKWEQRQALNAIPHLYVDARTIDAPEDIDHLFQERRQWIIKPRISRGGSRGVHIASCASDVVPGLVPSECSGARAGHGLLAEEVLAGPQLTIDAVVRRGVSEVLAVGRNIKQGGKHQVNVAIVWDSTSTEFRPAAQVMLRSITEVLGIRNGLLHVEAAATPKGLRPIEIAHRQGGGVVPDAVALFSGDHPVIAAINSQAASRARGHEAVVLLYLIAPPGRLAAAEEQPDTVTLRTTDLPGIADLMTFVPRTGEVAPLVDTSARLGHVLAYGGSTNEAFLRAAAAARFPLRC